MRPMTQPTQWSLARIADAYEIVVSIQRDADYRRAAAFVAGTAHQILAQELADTDAADSVAIMDRDRIHPAIAAAVLFLAAEQYADAHEAARLIRTRRRRAGLSVCTNSGRKYPRSGARQLPRHPRSFVAPASNLRFRRSRSTNGGQRLCSRASSWVSSYSRQKFLRKTGRRMTAGLFDGAPSAFSSVLRHASHEHDRLDDSLPEFLTTFPGPRHLASLLLAAHDSTADAAVTCLNPPEGSDADYWRNWLRHRAKDAPFIWPNHRQAVSQGFHENGKSAVLVLPTGAGKTTVSCLKIAAALASGKSVVFLAPTHALVDQLTEDLQDGLPGVA